MWREIFDKAGEFNAARLVLLSSFSAWVLAGVGLLVVAVVLLAWHNVRPLPAPRRRLLLALRVATVITLLVLLAQPGVRLENVTRVRNHVVVLIDASRSMGLPGTNGTRLDDVSATLRRGADTIETWRQAHQVDFYTVTDQARPVADVGAVRATGDATRLLSGLEDVAARFRPEDLAAVVVFSDGADNGALGEAVGAEGEVPPALADATARIGAPIHTFFTGPRDPPRDVAIDKVAYDDFAFVRNVVSIDAEISVTGYDHLVLPVTLRRGDTVLGAKVLQTEAGVGRYPFEFELVPDKTGKAVFTLEVGTGPNEQITVNNRRQFVVRIIRDKIRVLQVVGRPSWDERFLRKLLKKNPNVDLISFFILRTATNVMMAGRDELSLIPFPTQELFEEQLGSFDLIVFQNFTYRDYHMTRYLPLIRDFVRDGGGFVMIGGDQSFASGGYAGTAMAEFLPVNLPGGTTGLINGDRFKPKLTEAGQRHPITALSLLPEENAELWSKLPELTGFNVVLGAKPDAAVLLEHPTQRSSQGGAMPIVVAGEFGEGRVLAVLTDSAWHWDFLASGEGGDNRHYYKFWGNAVRWLIKDPALQAVRVDADRDRYPLGAEASLITRVFGRDYGPAADVDVTVTVDRVSYDSGGARTTTRVLETTGRTSDMGELITRVTPEADGAYAVRAVAQLPGGEASDEDVFVVAADPVELRRTAARRETLVAMARAGHGEVRDLSDGLDDLPRAEPRMVKVNRRKDVPLWSSGWLLLVAVLIPSMEWFLRRRWGLL